MQTNVTRHFYIAAERYGPCGRNVLNIPSKWILNRAEFHRRVPAYIKSGAKSSQFNEVAPSRAKRSRLDTKLNAMDFSKAPKGGAPHIGRKPAEKLSAPLILRRKRQQKLDKGPSSWKSTQSESGLKPLRVKRGTPEELAKTPSSLSMAEQFTSPPLLKGLLHSVFEVLGRRALPSPIQGLSLKHLFRRPSHIPDKDGIMPSTNIPVWRQFLLASETGSGKSLAYMLPLLQYLKVTEHYPIPPSEELPSSYNPGLDMVAPRGLILAPTHELSRQLSVFAKSLVHNEKLRVLCSSRANSSSSSRGTNSTASQMKRQVEGMDLELSNLRHGGKHAVDLIVGTPMKILEMARGWGWNKADQIEEDWEPERKAKALNWVLGKSTVSLRNVEYVVVDEADVLFDEDFEKSTRQLLADIAVARGYNHPSFASLKRFPHASAVPPSTSSLNVKYPYHLVLASATIPSSLSTYITDNHPDMIRLASPGLHRLPDTLKPRYYEYTGNKFADIEKCIRQIWIEEVSQGKEKRSKILIFCNRSNVVDNLHLYLKDCSIPSIPLTSTGEARQFGSNRHLEGFLKPSSLRASGTSKSSLKGTVLNIDLPHILITTSLLSRGLDFSADIKNVLIIDQPIDMIDFLHRAGRAARAGLPGNVIVFGKSHGRGSEAARQTKERIRMLL